MYPAIWLGDQLFIPTYFLVISVAFSVAMILSVRRAELCGVGREFTLDLSLVVMVAALVGSRMAHVLWEYPEHYWQNPWDALKIWQGGFVFYGGAVFSFFVGYLFTRLRGESPLGVLDMVAPVFPVGYAIGRFATLLSGSGYGRPTSVPWAIQYPSGSEAPAGVPLHPTPIYSMLWSLGVAAVIYLLSKLPVGSFWRRPGHAFFLLMVLHGLGRAWIEQFRDDFRGDLIVGLTVSTWLSLALSAIGATLLLRSWHCVRRSSPA